jgi:hypothetical protein
LVGAYAEKPNTASNRMGWKLACLADAQPRRMAELIELGVL